MADAHAKHHDYHLVDPSPWPAIGAVSAFVLAIGAIAYMKVDNPLVADDSALHFFLGGGQPILMTIGMLGVLYTMYGWWREVILEGERGDHTRVVQLHLRYGMVMFIASEVMFFVAWFWAFFDASLFTGELTQQYSRAEVTGGHWPPEGILVFDPWHLPLLNTVILLLSGTTVTWAHHSLLHGDRKGLVNGLICTVVLGALFTLVQAYEYSHAAFNYSGHIYGATFFMATGFHGFHVLVGTIFLFVCLVRAMRGHFKPEAHFGFEAAAWYWHFVDVVWLFLFACIYVWASVGAVTH